MSALTCSFFLREAESVCGVEKNVSAVLSQFNTFELPFWQHSLSVQANLQVHSVPDTAGDVGHAWEHLGRGSVVLLGGQRLVLVWTGERSHMFVGVLFSTDGSSAVGPAFEK